MHSTAGSRFHSKGRHDTNHNACLRRNGNFKHSVNRSFYNFLHTVAK